MDSWRTVQPMKQMWALANLSLRNQKDKNRKNDKNDSTCDFGQKKIISVTGVWQGMAMDSLKYCQGPIGPIGPIGPDRPFHALQVGHS
jgi:hypothetical protein